MEVAIEFTQSFPPFPISPLTTILATLRKNRLISCLNPDGLPLCTLCLLINLPFHRFTIVPMGFPAADSQIPLLRRGETRWAAMPADA